MRYATNKKEETRQRIVKVASNLFRAEGIEKVGVAPLMAAAGLTVGGFYSHFKSKEELIKEAVGCAYNDSSCQVFGEDDDGNISISLILDRYLNAKHRDSPEAGCVIAALSSELRNRPDDTRDRVSDMIKETVQRIKNCLPEDTDAENRERMAWSVWAMIIGTLQLARITTDKIASEKILNDGKISVLTFCGLPRQGKF